MSKSRSPAMHRTRLHRIATVSAAVTVVAMPSLTCAFPIDAGNPDVEIRWDNSLRYNLGVRAEKPDPNILNNANGSYDDSDSKFKRGDIATNRLDVLSEFDVVYRKASGLRVSAALWYDQAYHNHEVKFNPVNGGSAYVGNTYTRFTKRWNEGASGEFLDAFVFGKADLGGVPVNVKVGQHTIYWGESLFSFVHGVSYSQGPIDIRKALANPGVGAKEIFKPLPQISLTAQLSDELSVSGQYYLGWKPSAFPDGGTYFGVTDAISQGGGTYLITPAGAAGFSALLGTTVKPVPFVPIYKEPKKTGDWGLSARWTPTWLGGTAGLYYREYTDKLPQIVSSGFQVGPYAASGGTVALPDSFGLSFLAKRVTLIGASLSQSIAGVSVSAEIAHRANTGLLMSDLTTLGSEPTGDTWHGLLNAIAYIGKTPLFDAGALTAEFTYSKLDKLKTNPNNFRRDAGCLNADKLGCATKQALGFAVKFEPTWYQVFPGADLSMPLFYTTGIKGTSPVLFGGYKGNGSYSVGLTLDVQSKYNFALAYNDAFAKHSANATTIGGIGAQWDRGWVTLTAKASF
jgi:Protein of unknown function (DUF1302)